MKEKFVSVGVSSATAEQFMNLLVELDLLSEGRVSKLISVSLHLDKKARKQLAEQLYSHLVRWLGQSLSLVVMMQTMMLFFPSLSLLLE